ncbi:hypothetical protein LRS74_26250 [Streptomyces sp. LX-29]|uniref:hypothetical protein n=1 Tax=Streptomyces sp. LX-29 TaxID=2900152 RepID=UPI00240E49D4|nr:hypothetical protein [Streptomyces sp. LX-29]WFB10154.1 hypothetical protein LRS74_26250 [Streptomyces sp. LX-29]
MSRRRRQALAGLLAVPVLTGAALALSGCSPGGGSALPRVESGAKRGKVEFSPGRSEPDKGKAAFPEVPAGRTSELVTKVHNTTDHPAKVRGASLVPTGATHPTSADEPAGGGATETAGRAAEAGRRTEAGGGRRASPDLEVHHDSCTGVTLASGESCQMLFVYRPAEQGVLTTEFIVEFDGGTPDIRAVVSAVARPPEKGTGPGTPGGTGTGDETGGTTPPSTPVTPGPPGSEAPPTSDEPTVEPSVVPSPDVPPPPNGVTPY